MNKKNLQIADEIICAADDSQVWFDMYYSDPAIQKSSEHFHALLEELPGTAGDELSEAYSRLESDVVLAATLYGMRVMWSLFEAMQDPAAVSKHILGRMEGRA